MLISEFSSIAQAVDKRTVAAIFEWVIAGLFGLYLATFILDLWPAAKT